MGTGDCFVLKFFTEETLSFKVMIDCGCWSGTYDKFQPFINELIEDVKGHIDVLIVTHEHKDHVHGFDVCKNLFKGLTIDEIWMAWTENEKDEKVSAWQKNYGNQKKALSKATKALSEAVNSPKFFDELQHSVNGLDILSSRKSLAQDVRGFADLEMDLNDDGTYVGLLAGMRVVKEDLGGKIRYFKPGDIISKLAGLPGVRVLVLGPPENWEQVKKESGGKGESYDHNKTLGVTEAFAAAMLSETNSSSAELLPFESSYIQEDTQKSGVREIYDDNRQNWRRIDEDWLFSAAALAMRINSITNNLSLALAFEFEDSGKVMLFPGDAEYGSWASWHNIPWAEKSKSKGKPFMEDLLNRTVFYKVAHHLSHNGTARKLGMEMMVHPELAAMATLDYNNISSQWVTTMPNQGLIQDLVKATSGRLMVMNTQGLLYDKKNNISLERGIELARQRMMPEESDAFDKALSLDEQGRFIEYTLQANYGKAKINY